MQVNCSEGMKTKFHYKINNIELTHHEALQHTFHEFKINTGPDPEDLVVLFEDKNVVRGGNSHLEQSDYSDSTDSDNDTTDSEADFNFKYNGFNTFIIPDFQTKIGISHRPSG